MIDYKNKMYLIQRGTSCPKDFGKMETLSLTSGDTPVVRLDYMGSAEFEFGAIPYSYRRIMHDFNEYTMFNTGIETTYMSKNTKGKNRSVYLFIFCHKDKYEEILRTMQEYINKEYALKEYSNIAEHFKQAPSYSNDKYDWGRKTNFWWEIEMKFDFMACVSTTESGFAANLLIALTNDYNHWWMKKSDQEREEDYKKAIQRR